MRDEANTMKVSLLDLNETLDGSYGFKFKIFLSIILLIILSKTSFLEDL